jgi:hypothetical protein
MSQNVTNKLIYDLLKPLQVDLAEVRVTLADHTRQFIRVREDINNLRGDDVRRESLQAQMNVRLQRIEMRLNLTNA